MRIKKEPAISIDNVDPKQIAYNLIAQEKRAGNLNAKNWLENRQYSSPSSSKFIYSLQCYLKTIKSDKEVKDLWLKIEEICMKVRVKKDLFLQENQQWFPLIPVVKHGMLRVYYPLKDVDLFLYLSLPDCPDADTQTREEVDFLIKNEGSKTILATMALYENHIGRHEDALSSYARFQEVSSDENYDDAKTGKKVKAGAALGHQRAYGTKKQQEAQRAKYKEHLMALYNKNQNLSFENLKRLTAKHFKVSTKTIGRYVQNPKELGQSRHCPNSNS